MNIPYVPIHEPIETPMFDRTDLDRLIDAWKDAR